jgi:metal-sulfur cluster biosynthetic enzyme
VSADVTAAPPEIDPEIDPGIDAAIRAALHRVYDPCSVAAASPLSLIDMGLIRGWSYDPRARHVAVTMIVTSPACFLSENMADGMRQQLLEIDAVDSVDVRIDGDVLWSPTLLSAGAQASLDERRARIRRLLQVTPQQWRGHAGPP